MISISEALARALARQSSDLRIASVTGDDITVAGETFGVAGRDEAGAIQARHFVEIKARRRARPRRFKTERFWDDVGEFSALITEPDTGDERTRRFYGAGALLAISPIPRTLGLTVNRVTLSLSQLDENVLTVLQKQDARGAEVTIWLGAFRPGTREQIGAAVVKFRGFIAKLDIVTPAEGGFGEATAECVSALAEITRANNEFRAAGSQRERDPNDAFFDDAGKAGILRIVWGQHDGAIDASATARSTSPVPRLPGVDAGDR